MQFDDQQISSPVSSRDSGLVVDIVNAGEAVHAGFELEATWLPLPELQRSIGLDLIYRFTR